MRPRQSKIEGPSWRFEEEVGSLGATRIAGIDEAGRGPLAGPVVAAAVVLCRERLIHGLNDSKLLTEAQRERLYGEICKRASSVGIGIVSSEIIDEINILEATRLAMIRAVKGLDRPPDYALVDGPVSLRIEVPQRAVIKGDRLSYSIAAAGIVAKVTRDRIMTELHEQYPMYGFDRHKGYATASHREAIRCHGPCPAHRKTFHGVTGCEQLLFSWK